MTHDRYCSFCRAPKAQCSILIQGPEAAICGECVAVCVKSVMAPAQEEPKKPLATVPTIVRP